MDSVRAGLASNRRDCRRSSGDAPLDSRHNCRPPVMPGAGAAQSIVNHPLVHPLKLTADGSYQQLTAAVCSRKQLKTHETDPIHLVWPIMESRYGRRDAMA